MVVELHPHQQKAVDELSNGKILYGGVGVGKSITAMAYFVSKVCKGTYNDYSSMRDPKDVIVITTAKKRDSHDWEDEAIKFGISPRREFSIGNVELTVDSWNNIDKYKDVKDAFFIFDEQRVVGYGAWTKAFIKIAKHNDWILLSATPGDTWLDYIPVFIANGWYRNKTDFVNRHVLWVPRVKYQKVDRYINVSVLVRRRNEVLVHMPFERKTKRHPRYIDCAYDTKLFDKVVKKRWHVYEDRPIRDIAEMFSVARKVVNSDQSRLETLRSLMEVHPRLIVFYNFDYELEMLRTLATDSPTQSPTSGSKKTATEGPSSDSSTESGPSPATPMFQTLNTHGPTATTPGEHVSKPLVVAEWNGHKHDPVPSTDRWLYLVQYRAGAEGWNCVSTNTTVFFSQTYSYRDWWQAHGRIDRMNTQYIDLYYYHLISKAMIDRAIRMALSDKKNFNENNLKLAA